MSETMSSPNDWLHQFYQHNPSSSDHRPPQPPATMYGGGQVSDSTVVSTTTTTPSPISLPAAGPSHLNPTEGRVSKPIRRRSRASRRTPTTLLNTDTTNFRAMVQQFTGGPTAPFASSGSHHGPTNFSFGLSHHHHHQQPSGPYQIQFQQQPQQQQQQLMFQLNNNPGSDLSVNRLMMGNSGNNSDHQGGFGMEGHVAAPRNSASSSNENRGHQNYIF